MIVRGVDIPPFLPSHLGHIPRKQLQNISGIWPMSITSNALEMYPNPIFR